MRGTAWILVVLFSLFLLACISDAPYKLPKSDYTPVQEEDGWLVDAPEAQGVDPTFLDDINAQIFSEEVFFNIKSLLIARHEKLLFEAYTMNPDHKYEKGHVQSVTKSITSLILGIALHEGYIDSLRQPIDQLIPADMPESARKHDITIRHLATMRSGLDIDNSIFSVRMYVDKPKDPPGYLLDLPLYANPGETFYYRDVDPHLLSYIIQNQSGRNLHELAIDHIFNPLGISETYWGTDHTGVIMGAHGLYIRPRDLLKIGQLVLRYGRWGQDQLVDSTWIAQATQQQTSTPPEYGWDYGYYWWMVPEFNAFTAWGHGGNFVMILPDLDMVIVMTSMPDTNDDMVGSTLDKLEDLIRPLVQSLND